MNSKVLIKRISIAVSLIKQGSLAHIWNGISTRFYSNQYSIGLDRDLNLPYTSVSSKIDISIRLFADSDIYALDEGYRHFRLVEEKIPNCYIALDKNNKPCYRQWLIGAKENDQIENYFGDLFPKLHSNQALVEGIYTKQEFRGLGIMPAAMELVMQQALKSGYDHVIVYVSTKNIASLKGCHKSGFTPYAFRKEKWRLFKRKVSFEAFSEKKLSAYANQVN